jgi:hypothetical protein
VIYLYAIADRTQSPLPEPTGLEGAPLKRLDRGDLCAVFSVHAGPPPEPSAEALWAHESVVEALLRDRAVLPMRFGTLLAAPRELVSLLATREAAFARLLDRVRDRVELSVRVIGEPADKAPASDGTGYLARKLEASREAELVHAPLAELAEDSRRGAGRAGNLLAASYLLENRGVERFVAEVRRLQDRNPSLEVVCTGPWPAYSFVEEPAA